MTLTCTIGSSCLEAKARFPSWKEPATSLNTDGSGNTSTSSSVLHLAWKPQDRGATLQCHLSFPLSNSTARRFPVICECWLARGEVQSLREMTAPGEPPLPGLLGRGGASGEQSHLPLAWGERRRLKGQRSEPSPRKMREDGKGDLLWIPAPQSFQTVFFLQLLWNHTRGEGWVPEGVEKGHRGASVTPDPSLPTGPATLLHYACSLEKVPQCNCSFYGIPTPVVQWLMGGVPVIKKNMSDTFRVATTIAAPWANSTITFAGKPEEVPSLRCEGKNKYGTREASIFLVPGKYTGVWRLGWNANT